MATKYTNNLIFLNENEEFNCPICLQNFVDPVYSCDEEHFYCRECLVYAEQNNMKCSFCDTLLNTNNIKTSEFFTQYHSKQKIRCINNKEGECNFQGELHQLEQHLLQCEYEKIYCDNREQGCLERLKRKDLKSHKLVCPFEIVQCQNKEMLINGSAVRCQQIMKRLNLEQHKLQCQFTVIECPLKCEIKTLVIKNIAFHFENECQMQLKQCLLCEQFVIRKQMENHLQDWPQHIPIIVAMKDNIKKLEQVNMAQQSEIQVNQRQIKFLNNLNSELARQIQQLQTQIDNINNSPQMQQWVQIQNQLRLQQQTQQLTSNSILINNSDEDAETIIKHIGCNRNMQFDLLFRASRDGWNYKDLYERCSDKGPTLIICKGTELQEKCFGGYANESWRGYVIGSDAQNYPCIEKLGFLFNLQNKKKYTLQIDQINQSYYSFGPDSLYLMAFGGGISCGFDFAILGKGKKIANFGGLKTFKEEATSQQQNKETFSQKQINLQDIEVFKVVLM